MFWIRSQRYNVTVFYFDNISFLVHVLNQLFLPNESSTSQASYHKMILTIRFQLMYQFLTCNILFVHRKDELICFNFFRNSALHFLAIQCFTNESSVKSISLKSDPNYWLPVISNLLWSFRTYCLVISNQVTTIAYPGHFVSILGISYPFWLFDEWMDG